MTLSRDEVVRMLDELDDAIPRMLERYETPDAFWPIFSGSVDVILEGCTAADCDYARTRVDGMRERAIRSGMKPGAEAAPAPGAAP
jgi:hypothetical protein